MTHKLNCYKSVEKKLVGSPDKSVGFLVGYTCDDTLTVTACIQCVSNNVLTDLERVDTYLPGGVFIVGYFHHKSKDILKKLSTQFSQLLVLTLPDDNTNSLSEDNFQFWTSDGGNSSITLNVVDIDTQCITGRNTCYIDITLDRGDHQDSWKENLQREIEEIFFQIKSGNTFYKLDNGNVLIGGNQCCGISNDDICDNLFDLVEDEDGGYVTRKKKRDKHLETLNFSTFYKRSGKSSYNNIPPCAPVIYQTISNTKVVTITLPINTLVMVSKDTTVSKLAVALSTSVCRQLKAMKDLIIKYSKGDDFLTPKPYHYRPLGLDTLITVVYPPNLSEDELVEERLSLHKLFSLTEDRPLFRRNNQYMFPEDIAQYGYLINPHVGISSPGLKDGTQFLVQGMYSYHHYMQDRFDDNKWGCAYRSLQTLVSWFKLQGYTEQPIPGHKEIQQALVEVGDKEPKFVGSRQWIGSMEVSYVLDHLIGVTSKIMFVSTGADMSSKGRELAQHFQTQGTPIMIGGGVLAHTILGVDFNEVTGDVRFLILDPHYTGSEDLKIILDKGWCGWKGPDFWDQTAHYNLCMPQRPLYI